MKKFVNALINERSPYLQQHAHNPVNWLPWGEEAFSLAKSDDKPIFLSIGYSTCHWCHVMERESFEDLEIAKILNDGFISIKVDREERPEVDQMFINMAVQMTGSAGWPLSVWCTHDGEPIYISTYLPPKPQEGVYSRRPFFSVVCKRVLELWENKRESLISNGKLQLDLVRTQQTRLFSGNEEKLQLTNEERSTILGSAYEHFRKHFDSQWGGFGLAPKFPRTHELSLLLRNISSDDTLDQTKQPTAKEMAKLTLDRILRGGIHDHIFGGFHRYSVDRKWFVPHFEKMLYDQAGMIHLLVDACSYLHEEKERYLTAAVDCVDMAKEFMYCEDGFYSALDADDKISREEGLFYLWEKKDVVSALGEEDAVNACKFWNVSETGNFEGGKNILSLIDSPKKLDDEEIKFLKDCSLKMKTYRLEQEKNGDVFRMEKDDKILRDWNGYMIGAISRLSMLLSGQKRDEYVLLASNVARKLLSDRSLMHCEGIDAFARDYAFMIDGLTYLYETTWEEKWKKHIDLLCDSAIEDFLDRETGLFTMSKISETSNVPVTGKLFDVTDLATPSTNSMMSRALIRSGIILGREDLITAGKGVLHAVSKTMNKSAESVSFAVSTYSEWSFDSERRQSIISKDLEEN